MTTPPAAAPANARPAKRRIFRWKAIVPFLLVLALIGVLTWIFAEPVLETTAEEAASKALGTQVDIGKLDLYPKNSGFALTRLEIADPFNPNRNVLSAELIDVRVDPLALAEKKMVVDGLVLSGIRFGVERDRPARPADKSGFAASMLSEMTRFRQQFDVPILRLTPLDTVKQLVLDPTQLRTVKEAQALIGVADSSARRVQARLDSLRLQQVYDSATVVTDSLTKLDFKKLTTEQAARAIQKVQQTIKSVDGAKARLQAVEGQVKQSLRDAQAGVKSLDEARRADYAFARNLIQLPTFNAPDLSKALFGQVSIDRFQQAVYWASMAQKYLPPGLKPRPSEGPKRLRMAGTTVHFPKEHTYPEFLLRAGQVDLKVAGQSLLTGDYRAEVKGITNQPSLYGQPMTFGVQRDAQGSAVARINVRGLMDHVGSVMHDSVTVVAGGVDLPAFSLPGLPLRLDAGNGGAQLDFSMRGQNITGAWSVRAPKATWLADSAARVTNDLEKFVISTLQRVTDLEIGARLGGTVQKPTLDVRSNLDDALAKGLRAQLGAEIDRAEQKVRAEVDKLVAEQMQRAEREVARLQTQVEGRLGLEQGKLTQVRGVLDGQLKQLTATAGGKLNLPKIKL